MSLEVEVYVCFYYGQAWEVNLRGMVYIRVFFAAKLELKTSVLVGNEAEKGRFNLKKHYFWPKNGYFWREFGNFGQIQMAIFWVFLGCKFS